MVLRAFIEGADICDRFVVLSTQNLVVHRQINIERRLISLMEIDNLYYYATFTLRIVRVTCHNYASFSGPVQPHGADMEGGQLLHQNQISQIP